MVWLPLPLTVMTSPLCSCWLAHHAIWHMAFLPFVAFSMYSDHLSTMFLKQYKAAGKA